MSEQERGPKILVIDDENNFCFFVKANLQREGNYQVEYETDPKKGLEAARFYHPDLILLDILMPGMNGLEVLKKLKESKETIGIPVLMLTAVTDTGSKQEASRLYDEDYLEKPIETKVLKERIERILSRYRNR